MRAALIVAAVCMLVMPACMTLDQIPWSWEPDTTEQPTEPVQPDPEPQPEPEPAPEPEVDHTSEQTGTVRVEIEPLSRGWASIEVLDLEVPDRRRNYVPRWQVWHFKSGDGHCEHFLLTVDGPGSKRVAIINMYGGHRGLYLLHQSRGGNWDKNLYDRNAFYYGKLEGWHELKSEWDDDARESRSYLDGKLLGKGGFGGPITRIVAGCNTDKRRTWYGKWRNLKWGPLN